MKKFPIFMFALAATVLAAAVLFTVPDAGCADPPVVVKTVPKAGDTNVDPSLSRIEVTFSQDMMTKDMWSWVMESKATFPKITGQVHYLDDNRTCVAPVKLEPGKEYVIWFNSKKHNAFRNTDNVPAVPYRLRFKTTK